MLPRTDLAGLTRYAQALEELSEGKYKAVDLLAETRSAWNRRTAEVDAKKKKQKAAKSRSSKRKQQEARAD